MVSVAIYEKPLATPLLNLVMNESRIQGSLCYTAADFEAVIALMAEGAYDTTGWVTPIPIDDVIDEGFEALHAGTKMKVLVDPTIWRRRHHDMPTGRQGRPGHRRAAAASAAASRCGWPATAPTSRWSTSGPTASTRVAEEIAEIGSKATTFVADVSDRDQVFAAVEHAATALGGFDIMVNNAGIALVGPIADVTPEDVAKIWAINVDGVLWGIQAAVAKFKELGPGRGKIINASSIAGHDGFAMLGVYSATKFAVRALTQAAAKEHAADGITVNAYCPGVVGTDMWVEIDKRFAELTGAAEGETYEKFVGGIALGRAETPDDVAGFVSYLAGPDADYMTGQAGLIDGGLVYR